MSVTDDRFLSTPAEDYAYSESTFYNIKSQHTVEYIFKPILYCLIVSFGLVGNTLVLWVLICFKKMNSVTDIYLLNMAISDLLFVFSLPFVLYQIKDQWVFGNAMCKILSAMYYTGFFSGIFFTTVLSVDRYLAIVHVVWSLKFRTINLGVIVSFTVWIFAVLLSIPNLMFHKEKTNTSFKICTVSYTEDQIVKWTLFSYIQVNIFGLIIPFAIIIFCYSHIVKNLHNSKSMQKKYAVKLILILVIVFFLFWAPYNIVIFLRILDTFGTFGSSSFTNVLETAMDVTQTISFVHCCLNPVIYTFAGENFKKHLYRMFNKLLKCIRVNKMCASFESFGTDRMSTAGKESVSFSFTDAVM